MKIRKGDTVEIIAGREQDKGKRGEVLKILPKKSRVVVMGLNMRKKHQRPHQVQDRQVEGGIIEFEAPLHVSNVMMVCPKCNETTRVAVSRDDEGVAHRVCKSCKKEMD